MDDCPCQTCDPACDLVSLNGLDDCDECSMGIHRPDRDTEEPDYPGVDERFDGRYRQGHRAGWDAAIDSRPHSNDSQPLTNESTGATGVAKERLLKWFRATHAAVLWADEGVIDVPRGDGDTDD